MPENVNSESPRSAADILATEAAGNDLETDPVAEDTIANLARQFPDTATLGPVPSLDQKLVAIRLRIGENKREMVIPLDRDIHIGRQDASLDLFPEVDVTNDGPEVKSVSRRHAKISKQDDVVIIVDQGSSNGTFVNQKKLKSFEYTLLRNGDIVLLGKLRLEVEFITE